jgi:hypothetical protein
MMAVPSPPTKPLVINAGAKHVAAPPSPAGARASQHTGVTAPEPALPGLTRMPGTQSTTPERVPVAAPGA